MNTGILALLDGSIYSQSVCDHTIWAAERLAGQVTLLHALGRRDAPRSGDLSGSLALGARSALLKELSDLDEQRAKLMNQSGRAILDEAVRILNAAGIADVQTRLRMGDLLETVEALHDPSGLLVMGKRGGNADFVSGRLGANLENIARSASVPVLIASRAFKPIERVLLAFDGAEASRRALAFLAISPLFSQVDILIASVGADGKASQGLIDGAIASLATAGRAATGIALTGSPEEALPRLIADRAVGLAIMGAYGHSRLRGMLIGSTTSEIVRSAPIPVLLLR